MVKADYREIIYSRYASSRGRKTDRESLIHNINKRKPYFDWIISHFFPSHKNAAILDVGCGYGALLYCASRMAYSHLKGVEVSRQEVQCAHSLGLSQVLHSDALTYLRDCQSDSFDLVVCFDVLEHLYKSELFEFILEIKRVLRPKGKCLVQTVNAQSPFFGNIRYSDFTHENAFTSSSIKQVFESIGMQVICVSECPPIVHGALSLIRRILWNGARLIYKFLLKLEPVGDVTPAILTQNLLAVAQKGNDE